jgi:hypothetical protein
MALQCSVRPDFGDIDHAKGSKGSSMTDVDIPHLPYCNHREVKP